MGDLHPAAGSLGIEELLAHGDWLRGLVLGLVGDEHAAADVVQDTFVAALERPPRDRRNLRGWLGTVARNFALRGRLEAARRCRRERRAAAAEALRPTDEIVADLQLRERVVRALAALDEPYRSTLWWRFVERRTAVEIARAAGVSASAVRTRVQRGLERLRASIGVEPGGSRSRRLAIALPFLRTSAAGAIVMASGAKVAWFGAAMASAAALGWWCLGGGAPPSEPGTPADASVPAPVAAAAPPRDAAPDTAPERVPRSGGSEQPAVAVVVRGAVLDVTGAPIAGVPVGWVPLAAGGGLPAEPATDADGTSSDAAGRFAVALEAGSADGALVALGADWVTLRAWPCVDPLPSASIVVAPAVTLAGRIRDAAGEPVPLARIGVDAPELARFPDTLERHLAAAPCSVRADPAGRFRLERVPGTRDARLRAEQPGFTPFAAPVPEATTLDLEIVLDRAFDDALDGVVVDGTGAPVADAEVWWGETAARTAAAGRFSLPWPAHRGTSPQMVVVAAGRQPWLRAAYGREAWERDGSPRPFRVELGGAPLSIEGRVRNADGSPARGFCVAPKDATVLYGRRPDATAEQLAAGLGDVKPIEAFPVGADGGFRVLGLREADYRLVAWDPHTLVAIETESVRAGARGVDIVVPADAVRSELRGRVLSRRGSPLGGVTVELVLQILPAMGGQARSPRSTTTDASGRFVLADVPRRGVAWLGLTGDPVVGVFHSVEGFADREEVELTADARCRVRFTGGAPSIAAQSVLFVADDGELVPMWSFTAGGMHPRNGFELGGEGSAELAVSERARWLCYYAGGKEVGRRGVDLVPGLLNRIAP